MHYRPHYGDNGFCLTQMISDGNTATYFCVNYFESALRRLQDILDRNPSLSRRLFLLDVLGVDDLVRQWSDIIKTRREELFRFVGAENR